MKKVACFFTDFPKKIKKMQINLSCIFKKSFANLANFFQAVFLRFLKKTNGFQGVPDEMATFGKTQFCQKCLLSISTFADSPENSSKIDPKNGWNEPISGQEKNANFAEVFKNERNKKIADFKK